MIENLSDSSFWEFGRVYNEGFRESCLREGLDYEAAKQLNITSKKIKTMVCSRDSNTIFRPLEGLSLLCLSTDPSKEENSPRIFLMDKVVSINKGIFYDILPLYGVCSVLLAKSEDSNIVEYTLDKEFTPLGIYPKVNINKVYTLFNQDKEKGFIFKGERHNFWEVTYVTKGTLLSSVDGKNYEVNEGDIIFYGENQFHAQWTDDRTSVSFITITFDMDLDDSLDLTNKVFSCDGEIKGLFQSIMQEKEDGEYYSEDIILSYLKILIIKVIRNENFETAVSNLNNVVKNKIENSILSSVLDYIKDNITRKLTLSDIADHVHLSQSYLSSIFKKTMDITIIDYINRYKLEESKKLLLNSSHTITEVADILGYTSIHYFSRQFKSHFGISPSAYVKGKREEVLSKR